MSDAPALSVVIPAYNAASFIEARLRHLAQCLAARPFASEIIVVDDGSTDGTAAIVRSMALDRLELISHAGNHGKFAAVRTGMARAAGQCVAFTDADVPYELEILPHMVDLVVRRGFHMVIGDRTLPGARYSSEMSVLRRVATRAFTACIRAVVTRGLFDTQCGIKAFRADVARALLPLLREEGFGGDVEILTIALESNLEIKRVPARLAFHGESTVQPFTDGLHMLKSLVAIRARSGAGVYASPELDAIVEHRYWEPEG